MAWNVYLCETPGQKNHINNRKMCLVQVGERRHVTDMTHLTVISKVQLRL